MALSGGASPTGTGGMVGAASGGTEPGAAGSNGGVGATAAGDANAPGGNVGVVSPEDCPGQPGAEPLSEPTCSATVQRCSVDEAIPDSCAFSPLSVTIAKIAKECGIYCGFLSVGAQSGCIAGLNLTSFGTRTGRTREAAEACMTQRLVGTLGLRTV